jgi:hypothetical protein
MEPQRGRGRGRGRGDGRGKVQLQEQQHKETGETLIVTVVSLEGNGRKFNVHPNTTVGQLREAITSIYTRMDELMFEGSLVPPTKTMVEVGVRTGHTTFEMAPLPGSLMLLPTWPPRPDPVKPRLVVLLRYVGYTEAIVMSITTTSVGPSHGSYLYHYKIVQPPDPKSTTTATVDEVPIADNEVRCAGRCLHQEPSFLQGHQLCTITIGNWKWVESQRALAQPAFSMTEIKEKILTKLFI